MQFRLFFKIKDRDDMFEEEIEQNMTNINATQNNRRSCLNS